MRGDLPKSPSTIITTCIFINFDYPVLFSIANTGQINREAKAVVWTKDKIMHFY